MEQVLFIGVGALGFFFAFVNGFHDGGNVIAASVLSRSLTARSALWFTCAAEFVGPLLVGTAVATTIGREIIDPSCLAPERGLAPMLFLLSGLVSALTWSLLMWWVGLAPVSSHSLIGGLVGGALAAFGLDSVHWSQLLVKVILILLISPAVGLLLGLAVSGPLAGGRNGNRRATPRGVHMASLFFLGASHGTNNAQKAMAVITMMLMASGSTATFKIPGWVVLGCALALAAGIFVGGWKIAGVRGNRVFRIEPFHALTSQLATGAVIFSASLVGGLVSTDQIIKSTILGAGAGDHLKKMHRLVAKDIAMAWLISAPASALLAAVIFWCISGALGEGMGRFGELMKLFGQ